MRTTVSPYSHDKMLSLLTDTLIYVHYHDSNGNLVALLNTQLSPFVLGAVWSSLAIGRDRLFQPAVLSDQVFTSIPSELPWTP